MKNINDLREVLFASIEAVKAGDMDLDKARAINDLCQTVVNTAKVEVDFARQAGQASGSGFIPVEQQDTTGKRLTATGTATDTATGTVHRMR